MIAGLRGQQRGPFTAQQSTAGRASYQAHCASCHLADLAGRNEALPLAGSNFMNTWGVRSTRELFTYIQTAMPPGTAGKLDPQTYLEITAFILEANGAVAGNQAMSSATDLAIRSIASGVAPARRPTAIPSGDFVATRPTTGLRGLTVSGEVKNYVPVTDEM